MAVRFLSLNGREGMFSGQIAGIVSLSNDGDGLSHPGEPEMRAASLIVTSAVLAGCATIAGDAAERRVEYVCNYGPKLTVVYAPSVARIESADGMVTLQQRRSGSGFWYESGSHSLRGSGNEITYVDRQMAPRKCRAS